MSNRLQLVKRQTIPDIHLLYLGWLNTVQQELAAVFKKIGDKQTCTIGLYELYRITQLYPQVCILLFKKYCYFHQPVLSNWCWLVPAVVFFPGGHSGFLNYVWGKTSLWQVDIFSQLQNASEAFRTYISDGIAQVNPFKFCLVLVLNIWDTTIQTERCRRLNRIVVKPSGGCCPVLIQTILLNNLRRWKRMPQLVERLEAYQSPHLLLYHLLQLHNPSLQLHFNFAAGARVWVWRQAALMVCMALETKLDPCIWVLMQNQQTLLKCCPWSPQLATMWW